MAGEHGVDLVAAALHSSLAPDVAQSLIIGTASPHQPISSPVTPRSRRRLRPRSGPRFATKACFTATRRYPAEAETGVWTALRLLRALRG